MEHDRMGDRERKKVRFGADADLRWEKSVEMCC
jgi:hypothetical protein